MSQLFEFISQTIAEKGPIVFNKFMQLALYHPLWGYYSSGLQKFGASGDFITAPELTPLFGQTLANFCQPIFKSLENPCILEFGAGSGRLCVDILQHLERLDSLPKHYFILELSAELKHRQKNYIDETIPHLSDLVFFIDSWPKDSFNGILIANEVLDAMPVHRFLQTEKDLLESHILLNSKNSLEEVFLTCENTRLREHVKENLPPEPRPYLSEANLFIDGWIEQCYAILKQGAMLIIDYGFPRHEYYLPDRNQGSLMCHFQHKTHPNPLLNLGEQDITSHVDFTHVALAADTAGFDILGYTNQAAFLLANGLLSLLDAIKDKKEAFKSTQAVKLLIQANEMGELFKAMALGKNLPLDNLTGFSYDKRGTL